MVRLPQLRRIIFLSLATSAALAQPAPRGVVNRVFIASRNPLQLHIEYKASIRPQVQMLTSPDRLVIDLPDLTPGAALRGFSVNRAEVTRVRTSLLSSKPLVTRVVVDLNEPQWYRVAPDASGLLVTLGTDSGETATQSTIGWVSNNIASVPSVHPQSKGIAPSQSLKMTNGVVVHFEGGLMSIHARNATLSEVLFQIQKTTGAEIAIPAGSEQDRVAADFGPATPSQVMADLLTGTDLNFVVVGSEADPNALRSVILSRKTGGPDLPPTFVQQATVQPPPQDSEVEDPPPIPDVPPQEELGQPSAISPNPQPQPAPPTDASPNN